LANPIYLILAGIVVGFLVGMTGMGGGAVMTPFLILVLKVDPILAVGTDLVFASITKIGGGLQHWRQKTVWLKPVLWMALGSLPASFIGARYLLTHVGDDSLVDDMLPIFLGVVLTIVSVILFARVAGWPKSQLGAAVRWPSAWALIVVGAIGGFLVGVTSIGGGTVIMALMVIFFVIPPDQLVGLDVSHGAMLALFTAATYAIAGQVNWSLIGWLVLGSLPGVWLGARAVKIVSQNVVRTVLGILLFIAGVSLILT